VALEVLVHLLKLLVLVAMLILGLVELELIMLAAEQMVEQLQYKVVLALLQIHQLLVVVVLQLY